VDTHKDTHTLALVDALGGVVGTWEFPTGARGYASLERRIGDPSVPVGVEGASSYGAGLADHLRAAGYEVLEVPRPRRGQRRRGKSDAIDAVAAARKMASTCSCVYSANASCAFRTRAIAFSSVFTLSTAAYFFVLIRLPHKFAVIPAHSDVPAVNT
jgi:transposase